MMETESPLIEQPFAPPEENLTQTDFIDKELNFDVDPNDPLTKAHLSDHPKDEWMDILGTGQLRKKVLKQGKQNCRPNREDICVVSFTGRLEDGTVVEEEEDLTIQLGDVDVIQGLDLAIALMDDEEEAEIEVYPRFGYGTLGRNEPLLPKIPPDAKIIYNLTLKSSTMEPNLDDLPCSEKRRIGNQKRERGNWWFARDEWTLAIQCYRKALGYLTPAPIIEEPTNENKTNEVVENVTDADLQAMLEDSLKVHNNLAMAQMKTNALDAALTSVENVLRCQPQNVKALFRKAKILHLKGEHSKACSILTQAATYDPENKAIQQELSVLKKKSANDTRNEKNLYRKMLGNKPDNKHSDKSGNSGEKAPTKFRWSLLGGTIVAIVGIIAYRFVS